MPTYLDDYLDTLRNPYQARPRRTNSILDDVALTPEQTVGILGRVGGGALSGLAAAGNFLDVPGSMVRDVIGLAGGGSWQRYNPFDQLLDPLGYNAETNRASGRELLRGGGFVGDDDTWGNFGGGLAAEIALDPLTYLTLGGSAVSKIGGAARKLGMLDDIAGIASRKAARVAAETGDAARRIGPREARFLTSADDILADMRQTQPVGPYTKDVAAVDEALRSAGSDIAQRTGRPVADVMAEPVGGLGKAFIPFTGIEKVIGTGPRAQGVARAMDTAGDWLKGTAPVRFGRMLFDPLVKNRFARQEQELAEKVSRREPAMSAEVNQAVLDAADKIKQSYEAFEQTYGPHVSSGLGPDEDAAAKTMELFDKVVRLSAERGTDEALGTFNLGRNVQAESGIDSAVTAMREAKDTIYRRLKDKGVKIGEIMPDEDFGVEHFMRYANRPLTEQDKAIKQMIASTRGTATAGRHAEIRDVPTEWVNRLALDKNARADGNVERAAEYILENYTEFLNPQYKGYEYNEGAKRLGQWMTNAMTTRQPSRLAEQLWASGLDTSNMAQHAGAPWMATLLKKQLNLLENPEFADNIAHHAYDLAKWAQRHPLKEVFTNKPIEDFAQYMKSAAKIDQTTDAIFEYLGSHLDEAAQGATVPLELALKAAKLDPEQAIRHIAGNRNLTPEQLKALPVSAEAAVGVASLMDAFAKPKEWQSRLGGVIDKINTALRASLTLPFPAFHTRNLASGQFVNMATGLMRTPQDFADYSKAVLEARSLAKSVKAGQASPLMRELQVHEEQIFGRGGRGKFGEHPLAGTTGFQDVNPDEARGALDTLVNATPNIAKPLVRMPAAAAKKAIELGGHLMESVEFYNRVPLFIYLRNKGYSAAQAALEVKKRHFDYSQLTEFERTFMKRSMLFYSFTRHMAPLLFETLVERPGGAMAQSIKAAGKGGQGDERVAPEYIREQSSAFIGELPDKSNRYITSFGLPYEDVLSFGSSPVQEVLSRTTPLIKAPAELAFGKSLFQKGRDLEDLDPNIGRTLSNVQQLAKEPSRILFGGSTEMVDPVATPDSLEFLVANSPLSRLSTTVRTLTDPRKGIGAKAVNLGTGVRVSDVSPAAQDALLRERAGQLMKELGGKTFTRSYVPADRKARMSVEDQARVAQLELLMNELARRAKERKAAKSNR